MKNMTHGVITYEIIQNANTLILSGVYMNDGDGGKLDRPYEINNEIAKRKLGENETNDNLAGEYDLRYLDSEEYSGKLKIWIENEGYILTWHVYDKKVFKNVFKGMGIRAGNSHLAVSYVSWNG